MKLIKTGELIIYQEYYEFSGLYIVIKDFDFLESLKDYKKNGSVGDFIEYLKNNLCLEDAKPKIINADSKKNIQLLSLDD